MKSCVKHKNDFWFQNRFLSVQIERRIKIYLKIVSIQYEVQFWSWNTKMYLKDISLKLSPIFDLPYYASGIFNIKMVYFYPVWPERNGDENKLTTSEYCCEYIFRLSDALRKQSELFFSSLIPRPILIFWCLLLVTDPNLIWSLFWVF